MRASAGAMGPVGVVTFGTVGVVPPTDSDVGGAAVVSNPLLAPERGSPVFVIDPESELLHAPRSSGTVAAATIAALRIRRLWSLDVVMGTSVGRGPRSTDRTPRLPGSFTSCSFSTPRSSTRAS